MAIHFLILTLGDCKIHEVVLTMGLKLQGINLSQDLDQLRLLKSSKLRLSNFVFPNT